MPLNQTLDKPYHLFLTLSAQHLDVKYIIIIFVYFVITSFISYKVMSSKNRKYNIKRTINSSLAIVIGIALKLF